MPMKVALLSAMVFPGVGHIFLKKTIPGVVIAGSSFVLVFYLVSKTVEWALLISEKIQSSDIPLEIAAITEIVSKQSKGADTHLLNIATAVFIFFLLIRCC